MEEHITKGMMKDDCNIPVGVVFLLFIRETHGVLGYIWVS
jgi:hypothetical protein